jgi:hypothetical protein
MSSTIVNPPMEPVPMFHFCFGVVQLHGEEKDEERMFVIMNESILHLVTGQLRVKAPKREAT